MSDLTPTPQAAYNSVISMPSPPPPLTFLRLASRNLYRQPLRTSLAVAGVAIGIVAMVALTSVVRGMFHATQNAITAGGTDLLIFQAGVAGDIFSNLDEDATRKKLMADPDVIDAAAAMSHLLPVEGHPFFVLFGTRFHEFTSQNHRIVEGHGVDGPGEVILGALAKRTLKKNIGDAVTIGGRRFKVVGIFETDVVFFNGAIVMDLPVLQKITRREGLVTAFQLKVRPGAKPREVGWRIEKNHPELAAIAGIDEYSKVDKGLEIMGGVMWGISTLAMLIGGAVVLNTMWISVSERTRELGILRAVGWSRRRVMAMILLESLGVGVSACIVGAPLGLYAAYLFSGVPTVDRWVQPLVDSAPLAMAFGSSIGLSILGGALPAWRAARISPAEALRYE